MEKQRLGYNYSVRVLKGEASPRSSTLNAGVLLFSLYKIKYVDWICKWLQLRAGLHERFSSSPPVREDSREFLRLKSSQAKGKSPKELPNTTLAKPLSQFSSCPHQKTNQATRQHEFVFGTLAADCSTEQGWCAMFGIGKWRRRCEGLQECAGPHGICDAASLLG